MSGSVLGMHGLNWDTGPIHITAAKNRFLCSRGRANTAQTSPTALGHSYYQQHIHWKTHTYMLVTFPPDSWPLLFYPRWFLLVPKDQRLFLGWIHVDYISDEYLGWKMSNNFCNFTKRSTRCVEARKYAGFQLFVIASRPSLLNAAVLKSYKHLFLQTWWDNTAYNTGSFWAYPSLYPFLHNPTVCLVCSNSHYSHNADE